MNLDSPPATLLEVRQAAFNGPVELLLQLAQRQELDISSVQLHELTAAYLESLQTLPKPEPERMGAFLVVGARLIQLKALRLLPSLHPPQEEELGDWEAAMRERLVEYRKFKELAEEIMRRHREGNFSFASLLQPEILPREALQVELDALTAAFEEILRRLPPTESLEVELEAFSLTDKLDAIRQLLARKPEVNFAQIFTTARSRLEAVVIFLALLELIRLAEAEVTQVQPFGPIRIRKRPTVAAGEEAGE
jgi:segregation and condensation protein A